MNGYQIFDLWTEPGDRYIHRYEAPDELEFHCSDGQPLTFSPDQVRLFYKRAAPRKKDILSGIHLFPIISEKFWAFLQDMGVSDIAFHPVELICEETGEVDPGYGFLNILNNRTCFDRDHSDYEIPEYDPNGIAEVYKLVILEPAIQDRDLVRMAEIKSLILISARLQRAIETHGITGTLFQPLESYEKP